MENTFRGRGTQLNKCFNQCNFQTDDLKEYDDHLTSCQNINNVTVKIENVDSNENVAIDGTLMSLGIYRA